MPLPPPAYPDPPDHSPEIAGDIVLETRGLVKKYGSRTVVKGVSFLVRRGEVVGLLGANGAGKTTSFRMTCGLIPANEGQVFLGGIDVTAWPMYRRAREGGMGYLPQDRSVFGSLSTEKNLYIMMELLGLSRSEQKKRCDELLARFHLEKVRRTIVGQGGTGGLSGGERRRLEIARALLSHPGILLLDEPFANVDPLTVMEIQNVIRDLSHDGIAVLITDHQVDETLEITHRSYVIDDGRVLCSGTPDEVVSNEEARKRYFGDKQAPPGTASKPSPSSAPARPEAASPNRQTSAPTRTPLTPEIEPSAPKNSSPSRSLFRRRTTEPAEENTPNAVPFPKEEKNSEPATPSDRSGYSVPPSCVFPPGEFRVPRSKSAKNVFDEFDADSPVKPQDNRQGRSLTLSRQEKKPK